MISNLGFGAARSGCSAQAPRPGRRTLQTRLPLILITPPTGTRRRPAAAPITAPPGRGFFADPCFRFRLARSPRHPAHHPSRPATPCFANSSEMHLLSSRRSRSVMGQSILGRGAVIMKTITAVAAKKLGKFLAQDFHEIFGSSYDHVAERLGSLARSAIECLGQERCALSQFRAHACSSSMVGRDILRGRTLCARASSPSRLRST